MDSGPYDIVSATHSEGSKTEPLVIQDGGRTQGDDKLQCRLCSPGAAPISPPKDLSSSYIQCPIVLASPTMSPTAVGSGSEVCTGAEQEQELCRSRNPRTASLYDVYIIAADSDDTSTFDQQSHNRTRNDTELTAESPLYLTPVDSSAGGCSKLCEQLIESRDTRSCSPVSLEQSSVYVIKATTDFGQPLSTHVADIALAEVLPDKPSYATGVTRSLGLLTRIARSEQARQEGYKPTSQGAQTSEQNEQLLYLRDIAQLNQRNIVSYFLGITIDTIKSRYKHLSGSRVICQTVNAKAKPRVQIRQRTTYLALLTPQKAAKKYRPPSRTILRKQPISILLKTYTTLTYRHMTKQAKPIKYIASLTNTIYKDVYQRTSRYGQLIRHLFRHRLSEGYIKHIQFRARKRGS